MPIERDDEATRIIGHNVKGLQFYDDDGVLQREIYLQDDDTLNVGGSSVSAGTGGTTDGAPDTATYLVLSAHDDLTQERVINPGDGITVSDQGAGNNYDIAINLATGLTFSGGQVVIDQDFAPSWTALHTFAAGLTFNGASAANILTVPDNTADAVSIEDAGGLEYLRVISTDANSYLLLDPANAGINIGIGVAAPNEKVEVYQSADLAALELDAPNVSGSPIFRMRGPLSAGVGSGKGLEAIVTGESYARAMFYTDGKYGIGGGSATRDIFFSRHAANTLKVSSDADTGEGKLVVTGDVGIGVLDPDTRLEIYKVGTQLKLSGGPSDYATFAVAADGQLTITTVDVDAAQGHLVLSPDGDIIATADLLPAATDAYDLGAMDRLWRKGYLSELEALVFVETSISLVGGWLVIPHGQGTLPADLGSADTSCDFGQAMTVGDFVEMRAFGQVEYFEVGALVAGTTYKIGLDASGDRDLDGSGANDWPAGTAYLILGQDGDGRISLYGQDPSIKMIVQGAAYNANTTPLTIDADGISITMDTSYTDVTSYKFDYGATVYGGVRGFHDGATAVHLKYGIVSGLTNTDVDVYLTATHGSSAYRSNIYIDSNAGDFQMLKSKTTGAILYKMTSNEHIVAELGDNAGADYFQVQAANSTVCMQVYSDGDTRILGGLYVGATGVDPDADWIYADGGLYIGDTACADLTMGIVINQAANDDAVMVFKSSDVGHGMTALAEADTWGMILKENDVSGGMRFIGYKDADEASGGGAIHFISRVGEALDTTKSTAAKGGVMYSVQVQSGTGAGAAGADANLVVIRNSGTARFIFDAEGSAHGDVEWIAFDEHDDTALLDALEDTMTAWQDPIKGEFVSFLAESRDLLEGLGVVHFDDDNPGHAMVNFSRLSMLLVGALRQQGQRLAQIERGMLPA